MTRAQKESAFHLSLLVLVQWISLAVIILNSTALYLLKSSSQLRAIVSTHFSATDYMLIILGSISFINATIYLFLHIHLYFRLGSKPDLPFSSPRIISATQVVMSVILIALWTVATLIILTYSQESTSSCQFNNTIHIHNHNDICELFNTALMLAFAAVGGWVLVLLATLFTLIRSPIPPTTIFTIEAPPQRFSQPMLISPPDKAYYSLDQEQPNKPYYMGHYNKKSNVNSTTHFTSENLHQLQQKKKSGDRDSVSLRSYYQRNVSTTEPNSIELGQQSSSMTMTGYEFSEKRRSDIDLLESTMITTTSQPNNEEHYHYNYQPTHIMHPLSPPISMTQDMHMPMTTTTSSSTSFYTPRCRNILESSDSQCSFPSLSTIDSLSKGFQPIQFDLPIIQVGMLSHIDASFLQKKGIKS
ncbi:uncharacterized protein BX663DRAFT_542711 [Cokeromyces recurvatus]|uniref:uncharacterized protein n=1 Tax=Cokeromyces recurvatus TaxID=90255 RepID=UPI00221E7D99|nr:uncharacterized protein BX663DRAFT_542711 [Cokeromyces recurvatus]KAI7903210.1 hypothetical protein BX663DRAFT_542711 [Cokeromyces recurvatus]